MVTKEDNERTTIQYLGAIDEKLEKVMKLLALNLTRNEPPEVAITTLTSMGFTSKEIGDMIGLSASRVRQIRTKRT